MADGRKRERGSDSGAGTSEETDQAMREAADAYMKSIQVTFQDEEHDTYDEFCKIVIEGKARRSSISGVTARAKVLFKGHPHLLLGLNTFLPKADWITDVEMPSPEEKPEDRQEVINFIAKIKARKRPITRYVMQTKFQGDGEHVYEAFRDIIKSRDENKPFAELYQEVAALFKYDQDLLKEFASYYY